MGISYGLSAWSSVGTCLAVGDTGQVTRAVRMTGMTVRSREDVAGSCSMVAGSWHWTASGAAFGVSGLVWVGNTAGFVSTIFIRVLAKAFFRSSKRADLVDMSRIELMVSLRTIDRSSMALITVARRTIDRSTMTLRIALRTIDRSAMALRITLRPIYRSTMTRNTVSRRAIDRSTMASETVGWKGMTLERALSEAWNWTRPTWGRNSLRFTWRWHPTGGWNSTRFPRGWNSRSSLRTWDSARLLR